MEAARFLNHDLYMRVTYLDVKDSYGPVITAAYNILSIWVNQHTSNPILVTIENRETFAGRNFPKPHTSISASRGEVVPDSFIVFIVAVIFGEGFLSDERKTLYNVLVASQLSHFCSAVVVYVNHLIVPRRCPQLSIRLPYC